MLIDTHAHLNFDAYKDDADEVIKRSLDNNVWMLNVGSQYSTSKKAVELSEKYPEGVYAAVGLHPIHVKDRFQYGKFRELAESLNVKAIGEIGLDYKPEYVLFKEKQRSGLCQQLDLAKELNLPIIFHCRYAHDDLIKILNSKFQISNNKQIPNSNDQNSKLRGVIHCFTGNWEQAKKYLEMGLNLGFNGIILKLKLDEIIKKMPLERILLETDCPYLTPLPMTGRNEPIYLKYIAKKIAKIKNLSYKEISKVISKNAKKLFNI